MTHVSVIKDDITTLDVDVIVNAANTSLMGGGGVDGAIHRAGGAEILQECMLISARQGGCKTGQAVITKGGQLKARYVIHTVGPVWSGGKKGEDITLANCYLNSLRLALDYQLETIAFPNVSTGIYGFPKQRAAEIAINVVSEFVRANTGLERVLFCCFDEENYSVYKSILNS